jgi:hypothetical protein
VSRQPGRGVECVNDGRLHLLCRAVSKRGRASHRGALFPLVLLFLFFGAYVALSVAGNPQERKIAQNARATNGARECMSREDPLMQRLNRRLEKIFGRYQPGGAAYEEGCYERGARRYNHVPD